ncbi:50S ribosomal protein L32 [Prescottella agglutinans]|uniref:50S ribosomal protein L32 n=1 Tax=Prescottella agglutinans TaxID=1644129 RepID=UPI003D98E60B
MSTSGFHRRSRSRTRSQRAQWKTTAPQLTRCTNPQCGQRIPAHTACPYCGYYRGVEVPSARRTIR